LACSSSRVGIGAGILTHRAQTQAVVLTATVAAEIAATAAEMVVVVVMAAAAEIEQHCDYECFVFQIQHDAAS
jgi:hypothetical protein